MTNLIKEKGGSVLMIAGLLAPFGFNAYGLNMKSNLILGLLSIVPGLLVLMNAINNKLKWGREEWALAAFLIFFWISLFTAKHPYGFQEFITFTSGALIYLLVSNLKTKPLPSNLILWGLTILGTAFSSYGIYELVDGPASRLDGLFQGVEAYSTYPNAMAQFLLIIIPLNWLLNKKYSFQKERYLHVVSMFFMLINLVAFWLTFSRGAFTAFAVMLGIAAAISLVKCDNKQSVKDGLTVLAILVVTFISSVGINTQNEYPMDVDERITSTDISSQKSLDERFDFWKGALQISADNPWAGVGPGGFKYFYPPYQKSLLGVSDHPHNVVLKVLSESGYPAGIAFIVFLALVGIKVVWEIIWIRRKESVAYATLGIVFIGLTVHNLVDYNLNFTILAVAYFSIMGLLENAYTWHEDQIAEEDLPIPSQKFVKPLIILLSLTIFVVSGLEAKGYTQLKKGEKLIYLNPPVANLEFERAKEWLVFSQQFYELDGENRSRVSGTDYVYPERYSNFPPIAFYSSAVDFRDGIFNEEKLARLTELDGKNDFSYYLLQLTTYSEVDRNNLVEEASDEMLSLLAEYNKLMAQNAHQTVATLNPYHVDSIYSLYLRLPADQETLGKWQAQYDEYKNLWQSEIDKFNARYGTKFNQQDATADRNF